MSDIFENGIDSLNIGIRYFLYGEFETSHKHAILNIFHSIELFLKEKLSRIHPILIYKNFDKPINDDSLTVGLTEIIIRFKNLGIKLNPKQEDVLKELQRRRNRIEHHKFIPDDSHYYIIGKDLKFIYYFLPEHLSCALEDHLDEDIYTQVRKAILDYDERLSDANMKVQEALKNRENEASVDPIHTSTCPECRNHTVVINSEKGDFCFFCYEEIDITREDLQQCGCCLNYFLDDEMSGCGDCLACVDEKLNDEPYLIRKKTERHNIANSADAKKLRG
jgi:hypothetical protein